MVLVMRSTGLSTFFCESGYVDLEMGVLRVEGLEFDDLLEFLIE